MARDRNTMKCFEQIEGVEREVYYHYTSVSALFNIVSSKTFWLTNLKSSNDKKELSYSIAQFGKDLEALISRETDENRRHKLILSKRGFDNIKKLRNLNSSAYALSLCNRKDDLTHWDRYAGNCTGVAIGINVAALEVLYSRLGLPIVAHDLLPVRDISYSTESRLNSLNENIEAFFEVSEASGLTSGEDLDEIWGKFFPKFLYSIYYIMRYYIKENAFVDEDEIRLLYRPETISSTQSLIDSLQLREQSRSKQELKDIFLKMIEEMKLEEPGFATFRSGIRSYRKLCLKEIWGSGLIPEIILGPMCTQDKKELRAFLDAYGLKGTKIIESKVPIR